jgi:hypothetical protein
MGVVVGPVLARPGGYAFDTWTAEDGARSGYVYCRIEDTYYARDAAINSAVIDCDLIDGSEPLDRICVCNTLERFTSELVEAGVLLTDSVLDALCSLHVA